MKEEDYASSRDTVKYIRVRYPDTSSDLDMGAIVLLTSMFVYNKRTEDLLLKGLRGGAGRTSSQSLMMPPAHHRDRYLTSEYIRVCDYCYG